MNHQWLLQTTARFYCIINGLSLYCICGMCVCAHIRCLWMTKGKELIHNNISSTHHLLTWRTSWKHSEFSSYNAGSDFKGERERSIHKNNQNIGHICVDSTKFSFLHQSIICHVLNCQITHLLQNQAVYLCTKHAYYGLLECAQNPSVKVWKGLFYQPCCHKQTEDHP